MPGATQLTSERVSYAEPHIVHEVNDAARRRSFLICHTAPTFMDNESVKRNAAAGSLKWPKPFPQHPALRDRGWRAPLRRQARYPVLPGFEGGANRALWHMGIIIKCPARTKIMDGNSQSR